MKKVLLIEDDTALRENTAELLELNNYEVYTAANGKLGIDKTKEVLPDIVVCDIMMPEIDGYGVLQDLSSDNRTKHIPFIFLSAKTEHKEIRRGMDLGADDYLTKPFEEEELVSAIESRLAKAEILASLAKDQTEIQRDAEDKMRTLNELKNFFDDHGEILSFEKGEAIYSEGDHSNKAYLILKGVVKCHSMDEDGKALITSLHPADDFLGFNSFIDNSPHQESATAVDDAKVAAISKSDLKDVLEKNRDVSIQLMELLTANIAEFKEQLLQMAYSSVRRKTAQTLLQFAEIMNRDAKDPLRISRNDLASVAGIATESLIRTLSGFKKEGLIDIEGRNIRIIDLNALEHIN